MLSVIMLSVIMLSAIMLSVIMLSVIMLSVIMLSVIMLIAVAPLVLWYHVVPWIKVLYHYYPKAVLALAPWAPQKICPICSRTAQGTKELHLAFSAPQNRTSKWGLRDQSSFAQYVDLSEEILILVAAV
jgi:hypothetical protein